MEWLVQTRERGNSLSKGEMILVLGVRFGLGKQYWWEKQPMKKQDEWKEQTVFGREWANRRVYGWCFV